MAMAGTPRGSRQHARTVRYECTWLYHTEAIVKGILGVMRVILVHLQNQRMLCSSRWVIPGLTEGVKRDGRQTGGCRRQPVFGPRAGARAGVTAPGLEHPRFHAHLVLCDAASPGGSAVMRLPGLE